MGSTDSSILVTLQKQWEKQERLDRECNDMERQKEERKRMKEEREQRKEERERVEKCKNHQRNQINKAFEKIPRFDSTNPSYCFDWLEQTEALVKEHQGSTERNYYSTAKPAYPRPSTHYHKKLPTSTSRMQYYGTIPTSELCHSDRMPTNNYIKSPMRHYKPTTRGMHLSLT